MEKRKVFGAFKASEKTQLEEELGTRYPLDKYPQDIQIEGHADGSVTVTKGDKRVNGFPSGYSYTDIGQHRVEIVSGTDLGRFKPSWQGVCEK